MGMVRGRVAGLYLYPFKSAAGLRVDTVRVGRAGLRGDREWMAVDARGQFVSLRTHPRMALLRAHLCEQRLELQAPDRMPLLLPRVPEDAGEDRPAAERSRGSYRIWSTERSGIDCGEEAAEWVSGFLGEPCRVMRAAAPADRRPLDEDGRVRQGFADASPALALSEASLAALGDRIGAPVAMARFRPNIVIEGSAPFGEDRWGRVRIGQVDARASGPCPRCAATLVDPDTGRKGVEPLRTLATFRRNERGEVDFGMNLQFEAPGVLRAGDLVVDALAADR